MTEHSHIKGGRGTAVFTLLAFMLLTLPGFIARQTPASARTNGGSNQVFLPVVMKADVFSITPISNEFSNITFITNAGDERLFIVQKEGLIRILHPDGQNSTFLDIRDRVLNAAEQGLFNLVFDPDYATNGYFYVAYTGWWANDMEDFHFYVSRFQAGGNAANPASECRFYRQYMDSEIHNGGGLAFHNDLLYVGVGDDQGLLAAQEPNTDKGKIITIDLDQLPPGGCQWLEGTQISKGLRNPWRFDFDPLTGDIYIGDVNDDDWEEVNFIVGGNTATNFGWPCMEGPDFIGFHIQAQCEAIGQTDQPIYYYPHHPACAIIGGYVLRPNLQTLPQFIFGDACTRQIFRLTPADPVQVELLGTLNGNGFMLTTFGRGYDGTLYAADFPNTLYEVHIP